MSSVRYAVRLAQPASHLVEVELVCSPPPGDDHVDVTMPAWCPGSYLIRDYARFVRDLVASDERGHVLVVHKLDKQTWRVGSGSAREVRIRYAVYGHDLTVRTSHIDGTHAFLHGPATFIYPVAQRTADIEVAIEAPTGWDVVCAAPTVDGDARRLRVASIDELFDHPIHVGPVRLHAVPAKVAVRLAIWGERAPGGMFDEARLATDLAAIVDDHVARFGEAPFAAYTYLLMLTHDGYGGLEHRASSVNLFNPHFGASRKAYEGLLELLSHELFHAWNGKRIAPRALLHFDYTHEAYTPCLWVMEGLTSHYDRFALRTSSRITGKSLLDKVLDDWARLMATPGRAKQSLEASSFDAWIKLYKPDESNLNTTVSYYLKGGLVMFALDMQIRRRSDGKKSLDDVLRLMWQRFGAPGEPHPDELQPVFEQATGLPLAEVFAQQIRGTDDPALAEELAYVGLQLRGSADPSQVADGAHAVWLGVTTSGTKITGVFDDSPAQRAGLSPGDELVAIDRFRASSDSELRTLVNARAPGDVLQVAVFRRHRLVDATATLAPAPPTRWEIAGVAEAGAAAARYEAWLGEPHPGAQVLATVTTTARWL